MTDRSIVLLIGGPLIASVIWWVLVSPKLFQLSREVKLPKSFRRFLIWWISIMIILAPFGWLNEFVPYIFFIGVIGIVSYLIRENARFIRRRSRDSAWVLRPYFLIPFFTTLCFATLLITLNGPGVLIGEEAIYMLAVFVIAIPSGILCGVLVNILRGTFGRVTNRSS